MHIDTISQLQKEIDALNKKAVQLRSESPREALPSAQKALNLSQSGFYSATNYIPGLAESLTSLAFAHNRLGRREKALSYAVEALALYESNDWLKPDPAIHFTLGSIYLALSEYPKALNHYYQTLELARDCQDIRQEADALNHIFIIHKRMGDSALSEEVCEEALKKYRLLGDRIGEATIFNNQAMSYFAEQDFDAALSRAQRALSVAEEIKHSRLTCSIQATIGEIYIEMGLFDEAEDHLQTSLATSREQHITYIEMYCHLLLGKARYLQKMPEEALPLLQAALGLAIKISVRQDTAVCHQTLAETYTALGNFEQALAHFKQYHQIQQDIFNEESDRRLRNLQVIYQTKSAQQEAEIYQLRNVELQQEIDERQRAEAALQAANDQLQEQNEALDAYAHTVAHDLKQPLTAVGMHADMLANFGEQLEKKRFNRSLLKIKRASDRAIGIIDDLLLLATIADEEIETRPLAMAEILETVKRELRIENGQIEYDAEKWPVALGYAPWVEAVWANYVSNGLKYGGSPPHLQLGAVKQDNGMVRFWIKDNGHGLSIKDQEQLFIPFNRLHIERASGYGLGLSIVRRIVQRLDGTVGVESAPGEGSTFYFTLPAA